MSYSKEGLKPMDPWSHNQTKVGIMCTPLLGICGVPLSLFLHTLDWQLLFADHSRLLLST